MKIVISFRAFCILMLDQSVDLPSSGEIQTLPATSSEPADFIFLWYARSSASSSMDANGKAALYMPVALTYPSVLRRWKNDRQSPSLNCQRFRCGRLTIKKYDSGH